VEISWKFGGLGKRDVFSKGRLINLGVSAAKTVSSDCGGFFCSCFLLPFVGLALFLRLRAGQGWGICREGNPGVGVSLFGACGVRHITLIFMFAHGGMLTRARG